MLNKMASFEGTMTPFAGQQREGRVEMPLIKYK